MTNQRRWKFLNDVDGTITSDYSYSFTWVVGEWKHVQGTVRACDNGLHASKQIAEALVYVQGDVLARVEVKGASDERDDKSAHQSMRIVKAYRWTKQDSVALAVFAAELVIDIFEQARPGDDRPRKAIEAAKAYLVNPNDAASAVDAAADASDAAFDASYAAAGYADAASSSDAAAADAAYAAFDAANAVGADAAYAAANSAYAYTYAAAAYAGTYTYADAKKELTKKIHTWLNNRVSQLEEITP
jgi:hypothetical protein